MRLLVKSRSSDLRRAAPGAPDHARRVELAQAHLLAAIIYRYPGNQNQHHDRRQQIGGHDEGRVGTERHRVHADRWLASIICNARTRRRRTSLRIAARCSVTNSSENATAITSSGIKKARSSVGPPIRSTEAG